MNLRRFVLLVGLVGPVALAVLGLRSAPRPLRSHPQPLRAERRTEVGTTVAARSRAEVQARAIASLLRAGDPARDSPSHGTRDAVPTGEELDEVHPGLTAAYRAGVSEARAGLVRARRRCSLLLPDEDFDLEWEQLETFEPDETGGASLAAVEITPARAGHEEFYSCVAERSVGQVRVVLPEGLDSAFQVRTNGRLLLEARPDPVRARSEVDALRRRLAQPGLDDDKRALLRDHLALWECYATHGAEGRRECLEASAQ